MNYSRKNSNFDKITDYYEVEKIITRRLVGKNKIYLIKWAGYPIKDCTWEPISHLDKINFLVEDFDNNFVEYAKAMCPDVMSQLNDNDIAKLNDWRHKVVVKVNKFLGKDKFNG